MKQLAALLGSGVPALAGGQAGPRQTTRDAPIPHASGQSATPACEGWFPNADGAFGCFNRNYETIIDYRERAAPATGGR